MVVLVGAIFDIVKKILRLYFGIPNGIRWHAYKQQFITTLINEYFKYMGTRGEENISEICVN